MWFSCKKDWLGPLVVYAQNQGFSWDYGSWKSWAISYLARVGQFNAKSIDSDPKT